MTAAPELAPKPPRRWSVHTARALHRVIYRFTRGRLGPWRPKAGGRFWTMRLNKETDND